MHPQKPAPDPTGNRGPFMLLGMMILILMVTACNSVYTPKKTAYFRIDLPQHQYQRFNDTSYPYSFDYPVYASIVKDSTYFDSLPENNYWINIDYPQFDARLFLSYKIVNGLAPYKVRQPDGSYKDSMGLNQFELMVKDARKLTDKNNVAASSISDSLMHTPTGITGLFFRVGGNAATASQFFLSDSTTHFLRGALYFNVTPNADSLMPVQNFLREDLEHMINTLRWRNK